MEELNEKNIDIDENQVPKLISDQFTILKEYTSKFIQAKEKAESAKQQIDKSKEKGVHIFKMKNSIEDLQNNQVALLDLNKITMDLQETSLEYQKKLSEITQNLFRLGVANITVNRMVVKELLMRLEEATEDEIDEATRLEILNVVKELKEQEDLYLKTTQITEIVKEHDNKIYDLENNSIEQTNSINKLLEENNNLKEKLNNLESNNQKKFIVTLVLLACLFIILIVFGIFILK